MPKKYELNVVLREDITNLFAELNELGGELVTQKMEYPNPDCNRIYHVCGSTVNVEYNSPGKGPFYFNLTVYGEPNSAFMEWIEQKKQELK